MTWNNTKFFASLFLFVILATTGAADDGHEEEDFVGLIITGVRDRVALDATTLTAETADATECPVDNLATRSSGWKWRSPTAEGPRCTIDVDLGSSRPVGSVYLGGLNLQTTGRVQVQLSDSAIPTQQHVAATSIVTSGDDAPVNFSTLTLAQIADDVKDGTDADYATPDSTSLSSFRVDEFDSIPTPLDEGRIHSVRVKVIPSGGLGRVVSIVLHKGATEIGNILPAASAQTWTQDGETGIYYGMFDYADISGISGEIMADISVIGSGDARVYAVDLGIVPDTSPTPDVLEPYPNTSSLLGDLEEDEDISVTLNVAHHRSSETNENSRYVKLRLVDVDNPDGYLEASQLFIGPSIWVSPRQDFQAGMVGYGRAATSDFGKDTFIPGLNGNEHQISVHATQAEASAIMEGLGNLGLGAPLVIHWQTGISGLPSRPYMGVLTRMPSARPVPNSRRKRFTVNFSVREIVE